MSKRDRCESNQVIDQVINTNQVVDQLIVHLQTAIEQEKDALVEQLKQHLENQTKLTKKLILEKDSAIVAKRKMARKLQALENELVLKIPVLNKVYNDKLDINIAGLSGQDVVNLFQDGRPLSHVFKKWHDSKWTGVKETLQIKLFTDKGAIISPSKQIGTGRQFNEDELRANIDKYDLWLFVDVRDFPNIHYVYKTKSSVHRLYNQSPQNGYLKNFENIVSAK